VVSEPQRADAVRSIFRLYVEERRGLKAAADELNRTGVPTARGPQWSERYSGLWAIGTIRAIVTNPVYAGDLVWNRRTDARFYRIRGGRAVERQGIRGRRLEPNHKSDWHIIENAHEAIIPKRIFELAQVIMAAKPESRSQRGINPRTGAPAGLPEVRGGWQGPRSKFLLSGLMTCGDCGCRYEGYHQSRRQRDDDDHLQRVACYACGGYIRHGRSTCALGAIRQEVIERRVVEAVGEFYRTRYGKDPVASVTRLLSVHLADDGGRTEKERERLEKQMARCDQLIRNLLDRSSLKSEAAREAAEKRLVELTMQRAAAQGQLEVIKRLAMNASQTDRLAAETAASVEELALLKAVPPERVKTLLRRSVDRITVDRAGGQLVARVRTLPLVAGGPDASSIETLSIPLPQ
jgi:hypothetical protein